MAKTKRTMMKKADQKNSPKASRPYMPDYGIPKDRKGMLSWTHVTERMSGALHYWISTVDTNGQPHATPVDGIWLDDKLYFGGSTKTRRHRNLLANPAACIHLESAMEVVIVQGEAREFRAPDHDFAVQLAEASKKKYGYAPPPEMYESADGVFVFLPRKVLSWTQFPKDATRWQFNDDD
jgi:nitroimidazol reductase NimA-like FMN-containing flavoprotein (pyridoxamine 5'-phosphate oxidase superfamily)